MNQLIPVKSDLEVLQFMARTASSSGLYAGAGNEQKILMILLAAQELGIKPMTALNGGIWNIQGKIEISARLMNSMIRRAGHSITVKELNNQKCILEGKRADNGDTCTAQFTIEEAKNAGLANRDVWKKYTEDMLYARAMSRLARRLFSDVIGTAYVEGEIRDATTIEVAPQVNKDHFVDATEMIENNSKTSVDQFADAGNMVETISKINTDQWNELKLLIEKCSKQMQQNIWDGLAQMGINNETEMDIGIYTKIKNACMGHLAKQKRVENEESKASTKVQAVA